MMAVCIPLHAKTGFGPTALQCLVGFMLLRARSSVAMSNKKSIVWFRKGQRLHDNPALLEACRDAKHVYPIFILDPFFVNNPQKNGVNRFKFMLESLTDLDENLQKHGSRLLALQAKPFEVFPKLFSDWDITQLCFEADTEPYAKVRDAKVKELAENAGVEVRTFVSHTMYDTEQLIEMNGGKPPTRYAAFNSLVDQLGKPPLPVSDPPEAIPPPGGSVPFTDRDTTTVPSLTDINFPEVPDELASPFKGGETAALIRLEESLKDKDWVCAFEKPKTDPSAFIEPGTMVLSPYMKFGNLSPKLFAKRVFEIYREKRKHSKPPVSLWGQILWREFYYTVASGTPNFDKMVGNPICIQIPWGDNEEHFKAWEEGRTGYPWIDAIMTQLRVQGWIHHLARHCVACFLTRGDLWVHWEKGRDVFECLLLDHDWSMNNGNWMWLSASAFFNQYFRVYSPITFGKKYDKEGKYIRHFLPVLKDFPSKWIYEPWNAPLAVQEKARCIIGKDYPFPIVDHKEAMQANMAKMKIAYAENREKDVGPSSVEKSGGKKQTSGKGRKPRGSGSQGANKKQKSIKDMLK